MSVLQFKALLIPIGQEAAGLENLGDADAELDLDDDVVIPSIKYNVPSDIIIGKFINSFPLHTHWADVYEYGIEDGDEIHICKSDNIELIEIRINCQKDIRESLAFFVEFAQFLNSRFLYIRQRQFIDANYESLFAVVKNSWARMIAEDPQANLPLASEGAD